MRIRILTWNIHKGIGGLDRRYRPERIIDVLDHYDADLVLLQEVDDGTRRARRHRQVDLIGDALGLEHRAFEVNHTLRTGGGYGNAILSRHPISDVENIDLTVKPKKRRLALTAQVHVHRRGHERMVVVANTHLGLAGFERGIQLRRLLGHPAISHHRRRTPVLVGGDFNDTWGNLGKRFLEPIGYRRAVPLTMTYPAYLPVQPLDALFVRGDLRSEHGYRSRMQLAKSASDHLPLIADCQIRIKT